MCIRDRSMALLADGAGDKYKKEMKSLIKTVIVNNNSFDVVAKNSRCV